MMIVCFIRSDDTEGWNKNCSKCSGAAQKAEAVTQDQQQRLLQSHSTQSTLQPWAITSAQAGSGQGCQHRDGLTLPDPSRC